MRFFILTFFIPFLIGACVCAQEGGSFTKNEDVSGPLAGKITKLNNDLIELCESIKDIENTVVDLEAHSSEKENIEETIKLFNKQKERLISVSQQMETVIKKLETQLGVDEWKKLNDNFNKLNEDLQKAKEKIKHDAGLVAWAKNIEKKYDDANLSFEKHEYGREFVIATIDKLKKSGLYTRAIDYTPEVKIFAYEDGKLTIFMPIDSDGSKRLSERERDHVIETIERLNKQQLMVGSFQYPEGHSLKYEDGYLALPRIIK